ncbi:hypothetical protein [Fulvivirga ligni]|uniref:hypothetical protein n=1 Tax=Fulvivirga ligni TaxID=2904246 RepID=UPI001F377A24|nr:hypothetical protein [Fulvivirga ligni]UII19000.1 hypothetical protein LVD16_14240 [Fulvivirga ligni]
MKTLKLMMASAFFAIIFSSGALAQDSPKIIAVLNRASWCSVCMANEERAVKAFQENNSDGAYQFVINDLTSKDTARKSALEIKHLGLTEAMQPYKAAGLVCLFDAKTKEPVNQLLISLPNEDIGKAMTMFRKDR